MNDYARFKTTLKELLGSIAVTLFPKRANRVKQNVSDSDDSLLDRLIRFDLIQKANGHEQISELHNRIWAGANNFHLFQNRS